MKTILKISLMLTMMLPLALFAQDGMQDVIYLKNGSIYKGVIIEAVPNVSYKIKSRDGNVFAVKLDEIEKITKEEREYQRSGYGHWGHRGWGNDSLRFEPRMKGYFNEVQVLIENVQGGVRMVNGYKFNRFAYLGVGIGVDRVFSNPFNPKVNGLDKKELAGIYLPLYLYHAGDGPTKGRFTPFYAIEAGYAMAFKGWGDTDKNVDDFGNRLKGGAIAGAGLGFKIHSRRHRGHFSILFNVNYKQVNFERDQLFLSSGGQVTGFVTKQEVGHLIIPGIRLGIGF
ncbi:MAG: hypothetical protein RL266_1328 [Bacteroidota bacterium]|jgi:hypothetical protein